MKHASPIHNTGHDGYRLTVHADSWSLTEGVPAPPVLGPHVAAKIDECARRRGLTGKRFGATDLLRRLELEERMVGNLCW